MGGTVPPNADDVREAFFSACRAGWAPHFLQLMDLQRGVRGTIAPHDLQSFCQALVVTTSEPSTSGFEERLIEEQHTDLGQLPFRVIIGPDSCTLHFDHALGDAGTVWPLYLALTKPELLEGLGAGDEPRPLMRALLNTFARRPKRLATVLTTPRTPIPMKFDRGAPVQPGSTTVIGRGSDAGYLKAFKAERLRNYPGSTAVGVQIAQAMRIVQDAGLLTFPGVTVVADARRYLPSRMFKTGNLSAGAFLPLDNPLDPTEITGKVSGYAESGRPLLTLAAMAAGTRRRARPPVPWATDPERRSVMSFSYVGKLPWFAAAPERAVVVSHPIGHDGLGIVTHEMGRRLWASVTFNRDFVDPAVAEAIAETLTGQR